MEYKPGIPIDKIVNLSNAKSNFLQTYGTII